MSPNYFNVSDAAANEFALYSNGNTGGNGVANGTGVRASFLLRLVYAHIFKLLVDAGNEKKWLEMAINLH